MDVPFDRDTVARLLKWGWAGVTDALGAGPVHRRRLAAIDTRIVVSGVRGKSSATRWLHDVFHRRGNDVIAKITGDEPVTLYNGTERPVERDGQVRLYENERELQRVSNADVAVIENQGIRQYTTRLVNQSFVKPDVLFLINVREDHMDTLGRTRTAIARSLARSVPAGTTVINGESDPQLRSYLTRELERRDAVVRHVDPPGWATEYPGCEVVFGLNEVLDAVGEPPLSPADVDRKLASMAPEWQVLPNGKVHDAAAVNDVQSTEIVRRALVGESGTVVEPLVNLRADRRGRTASFRRYLGALLADGHAGEIHALGDGRHAFANTADFPVRTYGEGAAPESVLTDVLAAGNPVLVMGNTVTEFMRDIQAEIEARTIDREPAAITRQERAVSRQ
ncbi:folylpolyglutamate synthase/dihydrofolate synthase family protein [Haloarcula halophila]|uniref:Mur ligase family protein n=1 Tax=Haloarcula TaxID=2237 RepID=UPI0023E463AE|nr:Mur ligase family protein [Halomicroarcula sp. DFY41]